MGFLYVRTGAHTITIESTRRYVKAFRNPYKLMVDYVIIWNATCMRWGAHPTTSTTSPACKHWLEPVTSPYPYYMSASLAAIPLLTSILSTFKTAKLVACTGPRMTWGVHSYGCAHHTPLKLWTTVPRSEGVLFLNQRLIQKLLHITL